MARQVTRNVIKQRVKVGTNKRTGKPIYKYVKTRDEKVVNTNVLKNNSSGGKPWSSDAAALQSEKMSTDLAAIKAKESGKTARITALATNANVLANQAINKTGYTQNTAVEQIVNGGLQQGLSHRDEDDDGKGSSWVD